MIAIAGEALIDLVDQGGGHYVAHPGGSPANVAVGVARLGVPARLLARLSSDGFGRLLRRHLTDTGVDLALAVDADEPTTLAVASLDAEGRAAYSFYVHGTADWQWQSPELPDPLPADVSVLHLGSLALAVEPGARVLEDLMSRERAAGRVIVSYDPNVRMSLERTADAARARVERQVAYAHVVKASADDLAELYPGMDPHDVAGDWRARGPSLVIVTAGPDGAFAVTGAGMVQAPAPSITVADTVGAGDSFTAALLAGLHDRGITSPVVLAALGSDVVGRLVEQAVAAAAITCTRPGADPPSRAELASALG